MTWYDVKLATLQKMFSADGSTITEDEATVDYIAGMPQVCNEALQLLSTVGKYIIKEIEIANNPISNLLSDSISKYIIQLLEEKSYKYSDVKSYTFSYTGQGSLEILVNDVSVETRTLPRTNYYETYQGLVDNPNGYEVELIFTPTYPSAIKDFALYNVTFENADDIPTYKKVLKYDLKDLVSDYYRLDSGNIFFEGDEKYARYIQTTNFFQEGNDRFVIDREIPGNYIIKYKAYPPQITTETEDDYELPLDPEVAVLLPLYMASQLYKDDDGGLATGYRNEFEVARAELVKGEDSPVAEKFISESGW